MTKGQRYVPADSKMGRQIRSATHLSSVADTLNTLRQFDPVAEAKRRNQEAWNALIEAAKKKKQEEKEKKGKSDGQQQT